MSRHARSLEQIRSLLKQMDRSVEDARARREGTPTPDAAPANPPLQPPTSSSALIGETSRPPVRPGATPGPARSHEHPATGHSGPLSALSGGIVPASSGPPRVKAKPKKPGSSDPLQDFQQRQAS